MIATLLADVGILAQASLQWTPVTYYVLMGIVHMILILVGFRLMGVDPEANSFVGAVLAAGIINLAAYFLRDQGVFGAIAMGGLLFGMLAAVSGGEVLKSFFMGMLVISAYGLVGMGVLPRTPLELHDVNGFTRIVLTGGLEAEPITEKEAHKMMESEGAADGAE